MVTSAVAGALGGLSAGNLGAAASGAMAPYIANEIKKQTTTYDAEGNPHPNLITNTMAHAVAGAVLAQLAGNDVAAGAAGAAGGELMAQAIIATMYPGVTDPNKLTESQKQTVSALSQIAAGLAGGLASDSGLGAGTGAVAGKNAVENNYLSSSEKSRQTYLNLKQNLTPEEKQERDALNRKDLESDLAAYAACSGQGGDCDAERAKAKAAQDTYFNQTYQNPKEAQAGYQQIQNLLNSTDPNAKEVFNILDGYTRAFMSFGYTEAEAKERAGAYVGSIYIAGGASAVVTSGALAKQFGKDVAPSVKPGSTTVSSFDANEIRFSQNTVSYNKTDRGTGVKYTYDDLVASMIKDGWNGDPVDVIKMPDGNMTSMDNTRISAAREAGIKVEANVRNFNDPLPQDMIDSGRFGAATTWGEAITGRINNQSGGFGKDTPYGSSESPRVTGNK